MSRQTSLKLTFPEKGQFLNGFKYKI